jgi:TorA maturation chaperone TorD
MNGGAAITAAARGQLYDLLATVFRRPLDARRLELLRAPEMLAAMSAAAIDPGQDFVNGDCEALLDRLAIDYTQLFHGPVERISPYECIQLGDSEDLMGAAAEEVRWFMAEVGFKVPPESGELPDHISVELAFMAELARREAEALESDDRKTAEFTASLQHRFLTAHLGRWAERFARKVWDQAATPFYAAMAELLSGYIADERGAQAA